MAISVLVMISVRSLGQLIQQALQETGLYSVVLVNSDEQAVKRVNAEKFPVAVLDFDLHPNPPELVTALRSAIPELRIVAIGFDADTAGPEADELSLDVCLGDPFYLPDLFDALDDVTGTLKSSPSATAGSEQTPFPSSVAHKKTAVSSHEAPPWLQDVTRAAQHLTRLSLESTAQAALITRGEQLWAYAGQLPQPAAEELARSVGHYWGRDGGSDMARFVRLDATAGEYMIYAIGLGGEFVLALAYETEIPFSEIRSRAGDLARRLALPPQEIPDSHVVESAPKAEAQPETPPAPQFIDNTIPEDEPPLIPSDWRPDQEVVAEGRQAFLEELLSAIEVPDPGGLSTPETSLDFDRVEVAVAEDMPSSENSEAEILGYMPPQKSRYASPDIRFDAILPKTQVDELLPEIQIEAAFPETQVDETLPDTYFDELLPEIQIEESLPATQGEEILPDTYVDELLPEIQIEAALPATQVDESLPDHLAETLPTPVRKHDLNAQPSRLREIELEPETPTLHNLTYACVLVPRLPQHHLVSDLAIQLNQWVNQVSLIFGWRLEHLSIRPNYLHWVAFIPPATSPGYMVRNLRQYTSQQIFAEFSRLELENPSGDFWAPGYLIVNGQDSLPQQVVQEFIGKTRASQGVQKSRSRI
ncbi:MAG: transposase [Chloroflexota bacterium]